jgi:hypothetical protein
LAILWNYEKTKLLKEIVISIQWVFPILCGIPKCPMNTIGTF